MPFINSANSFIPYHTGPYLQKGSGVFSVLGDWASRYVVPWMSRAAKSASSNLMSAVKSKSAQRLAHKAGKAAIKGVLNTTQDITDGKNVKEALKNNLDSTRQQLTDAIKNEVHKTIKRKMPSDSTGGQKKKRPAQTTIKKIPSRKPKLLTTKKQGQLAKNRRTLL